jgi:signal transduction histidine kinase
MLKKRERLTTLGELCGAVAHHYNNLLCGIATSIEYAMNMNTMTAMRRALLRTTDAVGRASQITRQLLAFAQADHRASDQADLTEIVLYYFDQTEKRLARHNIELALDWQRIPACPLPREQVIVVLDNLVNNAIEAMPSGGTLTVTLARRDEKSVCVSIIDGGGGMSTDNFEHLFEPFYTTKGELGSGTGRNAGMGLAVAHGLVNEMSGTITASNVPGRGARFDVVLPLPDVS